jgi:hypothetical protein
LLSEIRRHEETSQTRKKGDTQSKQHILIVVIASLSIETSLPKYHQLNLLINKAELIALPQLREKTTPECFLHV